MAQSSKKQGDTAQGQTRRKSEPPQAAKQTKKQIAFSKKEARQNRIILLSVGALILVILIVGALGVYQELVAKPGNPVAIVNGTKIRTVDFQDLLTYFRYNLHQQQNSLQSAVDQLDPTQEENQFLVSFYQQQLAQLQSTLDAAPQTTVDELINDALVHEKAEELGLTITTGDVQQAITADLQRAVSAQSQTSLTDTQQITTPVPQEQIDQIYQNVLSRMTLSDKAFHAIRQRGLLREKVQEILASQVPTTGLVIHVQLIQVTTEEQALAVQKRIENGEDLAVVSREVSTDTLSTENGGDVGWVTTGQLSERYGQAVEDQAFSLEVGKLAVVKSDSTFYVLRVSERNENGPLPTDVLTQRQDSALTDWLAERKASPDVKIEQLLQSDQIPADPFLISTSSAVPTP
jgi:ParB-like chromosome segregation protein Spo0J